MAAPVAAASNGRNVENNSAAISNPFHETGWSHVIEESSGSTSIQTTIGQRISGFLNRTAGLRKRQRKCRSKVRLTRFKTACGVFASLGNAAITDSHSVNDSASGRRI